MIVKYILLATRNVLKRYAVRLDPTNDVIVVRRYIDGMKSRKGF